MLTPGAAIALENARLYTQAQRGAALEERQRVARELHDAVTQTLFSASLIAEVLPEMWERDPAHSRRLLQDLQQLSRGALAEMRTLLLELRLTPYASQTGRSHQLAEALPAEGVPVAVELERQYPPRRYAVSSTGLPRKRQYVPNTPGPPNTIQPAPAGSGPLKRVELRNSDDGCGFDPAAPTRSMAWVLCANGPRRLGRH
jgi:two-component system nitrate/nitrite sensor histidine kinase NarX